MEYYQRETIFKLNDGWKASLTQSDMTLSKLREMVKDREARCAAFHGAAKSRTWLSDWATTMTARKRGTIASKLQPPEWLDPWATGWAKDAPPVMSLSWLSYR